MMQIALLIIWHVANNTMTGALAIFVKTPSLSPVKTRLAASIGKKNAEDFQYLASRAVSSVVQSACKINGCQSYYAVAEKRALAHPNWQDLPCIWQGDGCLGERMALIYHALLKQHDFAILLGSDIPQITTTDILDACHAFSPEKQTPFVFGPSKDGGFWLFGGNKKTPLNSWTDVTYSQANTGQQFLDHIKPLGDVTEIATLQDVDELGDLIQLHQTLQHLITPTSSQKELLNFLNNLP